MTIHDSILDTIGSTPIVKLHRLAPRHVSLYAKVEAFNPGGSVKDRLALAIVLDAEQKGLLKPGQTIVEATSGNTGIALAMVAAARGYPFVAVMTETFSIERRKLMRAYGARVILTPAAERGSASERRLRRRRCHHRPHHPRHRQREIVAAVDEHPAHARRPAGREDAILAEQRLGRVSTREVPLDVGETEARIGHDAIPLVHQGRLRQGRQVLQGDVAVVRKGGERLPVERRFARGMVDERAQRATLMFLELFA